MFFTGRQHPTFLSVLSLALAGTLAINTWASQCAQAAERELTVYNQNFALVKDYRNITLPAGSTEFALDNVPTLIDPTSVHLKSLSNPTGLEIIEQNFKYDLITKANILDRMVGQTIRFSQNGVIKEGVLLNPVTSRTQPPGPRNYGGNSYQTNTTNEFAVKTADGVLLTKLDDVLIDQLPEGLYPRPMLVWKLQNAQAGGQKTELSYLTDGINWTCDYVAVIDAKDSKLDLTGWVTLDNQSGASYPNTTLKLVAGDVRRVQPGGGGYGQADFAVPMAAMERMQKNFNEETFFEYHLYTLNTPTTLANSETKQISLVQANNITVQKQFIFDPNRSNPMPYGRWGGGNGDDSQKVKVVLTFKNADKNNLGLPLPKGRVRVQKADSSGSLQFVGEDWIDHTPKNEDLNLYVGDAFDIVAEKKQVTAKSSSTESEATYSVTLRNHKAEPVTVQVKDRLYGNWKIVDANMVMVKENATAVHFNVPVAADGEATLTYTVKTWSR